MQTQDTCLSSVSSIPKVIPRCPSSRRNTLQRAARTQLPRAGTPEPHKVHLHTFTWIAAFISLGTDPDCVVLCIGHRLPPGNWTRYHPCHASTTSHRRLLRFTQSPPAGAQFAGDPPSFSSVPTRLISTLIKSVYLLGRFRTVQEIHDEASCLAVLQAITTASPR